MQLPLTARPDFAGSVVVYKAASLEAVWELVEGDPFYKEGVVRGMLLCEGESLVDCFLPVGQGRYQDRARTFSGVSQDVLGVFLKDNLAG